MQGGFQASGGWIEVIAGVMFSGKTEELLRRVRRATIARKRVQVFKSHLDDRYAGLLAVSSHDRRSFEATPVDTSQQIMQRIDPMAQVVAIDEAQFLDSGIVRVATTLAELMAVAEVVDKLHAICVLCGSPASRNQRLIGGQPAPYDSPTIMVGAADSYEARCRACHIVPRRDESQAMLDLTAGDAGRA
jgi:thymidine kinase